MGTQVENSATEDGGTVELLAASAEDYCRRALGVERLRALRGNTPAFDSKVWRELCDLGWPRIAAPEGVGGLELGAAAVGTVCRQLGRVAAPEPLLESGVLVSSLLGCLATTKARDRLEKILEAQSLIGISLMESDENLEATSTHVSAMIRNGGYLLDGVSRGLPLATDMEAYVICAYCDENPMLFFIPANQNGIHVDAHELADGTTNGHIEFRSVLVAEHALLGEGLSVSNALDYTRDLARLGSSAYLLGIAETLFEMTLEYLCTREQFGHPIGSFQALQHRAVDLFIQKTLTASVVDECLAEFDGTTNHDSRRRLASRAKYRAGEAALLIARQAVQLHGGIGFTDECDVGLYLNRALVIAARYGNSSFHCRRLSHLLAPKNDDDESTFNSNEERFTNEDWNKLTDDEFRLTVRSWL